MMVVMLLSSISITDSTVSAVLTTASRACFSATEAAFRLLLSARFTFGHYHPLCLDAVARFHEYLRICCWPVHKN